MHDGPEARTVSQRVGNAPREATSVALPALSDVPRMAGSGARPYVAGVLLAGCVVLSRSLADFSAVLPPVEWWMLVLFTLVSGSAVLKIPSVPVNFSISDVFTLTSAVVFGPAAGTLTVAIDSLAISARLARTGLPVERVLFNAAAPPIAMWISSSAFFYATGFDPLFARPRGIDHVGPWLLLFAGLYFLLNTFAIAVAIALHDRQSAVAIWRAHCQNLWLSFIGGALGAGFVVFAMQLGTYAVAFLSVPLLLALILHFAYRHATGRVSDQLHHLAEVNRAHLSTIEALAHAIDAKDAVTHGHIRRVQASAVALAARVGLEDPLETRAIEAAALLHDIGKLAIPEHILSKPGKLTHAEFERMKTHARVGAEILSEVDFPYPVVPIVRHHHENWDGTGYPDGLKGLAIPIGARILSVVDCFDALTSKRPYRRALSPSEAFAIIESRRGIMYDPAIVDAFRDVWTSATLTGSSPVEERLQLSAPAASGAPQDDPARITDHEIRLAVDLGAALARVSEDASPWKELTETLRQLPGVDTAAFFVVDQEQDRLVAAHAAGRHAAIVSELSMAVGERMSGWVAATGRPMINADAGLDLFETKGCFLRSAIAVPCTGPGGERTVLTLYSTRDEAFSPAHQRLLAAAASFVHAATCQPRVWREVSARTVPWPESTRH